MFFLFQNTLHHGCLRNGWLDGFKSQWNVRGQTDRHGFTRAAQSAMGKMLCLYHVFTSSYANCSLLYTMFMLSELTLPHCPWALASSMQDSVFFLTTTLSPLHVTSHLPIAHKWPRPISQVYSKNTYCARPSTYEFSG